MNTIHHPTADQQTVEGVNRHSRQKFDRRVSPRRKVALVFVELDDEVDPQSVEAAVAAIPGVQQAEVPIVGSTPEAVRDKAAVVCGELRFEFQ